MTGLLVAEVNINTLCELGAGRGVSLRCVGPGSGLPTGAPARMLFSVPTALLCRSPSAAHSVGFAPRSSMARRTLGDGGAAVVSATYLLIHYALLVACEWRSWASRLHLPLPARVHRRCACCGCTTYASSPAVSCLQTFPRRGKPWTGLLGCLCRWATPPLGRR